MRVLQICLKPPVPSIDGGCLAMDAITQGLLNQDHQVKVLTINTPKHPFKKKSLSEDYVNNTSIESVFIDTSVKPIKAFCNLFTRESYNIKRFYCTEFKILILNTLQKQHFDIIILESLFVMPYVDDIRNNSNAKVIYRSHNIEHEIWERNAKQTKGFKKNYIKLLAKRLKEFEVESLNKVDAVVAITEKDKTQLEKLGCVKPINVTPFGININKYDLSKTNQENIVFHIGSMDWLPNQDGVKWLMNNVWEKVVVKNPNAKIKLAGKNMPHWMKKYESSNVAILGEVDNAIGFMNQNSILVVPLFSGSGMRIKVIEAMALGKLVITTSIGAEGINYKDKTNIIIANTELDFVNAIDCYLNNSDGLKQIGDNAKQLVQSNYDNTVIVNNLVAFLNELK